MSKKEEKDATFIQLKFGLCYISSIISAKSKSCMSRRVHTKRSWSILIWLSCNLLWNKPSARSNLIFNTRKRASLARGADVIVDLLLSCDDLFGLVFFVLASKDSNAMFYCKQTQPSVKKLSLSCDIRSFSCYFAISDWLS